jgi:rhodanese-related sulfurtransferase
VLTDLGKKGALLILAAFIIFIVSKWWQRQLFIRSLRMARISVDELDQLLQSGAKPIIIDVRSPQSTQDTGRIPGALITSLAEMHTLSFDIPDNGEVIVYCACPNEASAARVAKLLMQKGYTHVRPLAGGIDAWIAAGYTTMQ